MKRSLLICVFILFVATTSFGQTTFYFPHVVNGGGWKTSIFLTNPAAVGSANASATITFTQQNATLTAGGTPMPVNFADESGNVTTGTITSLIAGGQSHKFVSDGQGAYVGGFATVTSSIPVTGVAIFSYYVGGNLFAEAGVPAGSAVARQSIFVDIGNGFDVGVAFSNPGSTAVSVTLQVLNSGAQTVLSTALTLGAQNHTAAYVSQFFPTIQPMSGTMQILGSGPLAAIALRFYNPTGVFTTLPPVTIASMTNDAIKWFRDRPWTQPIMSLSRLMASLSLRLG